MRLPVAEFPLHATITAQANQFLSKINDAATRVVLFNLFSHDFSSLFLKSWRATLAKT